MGIDMDIANVSLSFVMIQKTDDSSSYLLISPLYIISVPVSFQSHTDSGLAGGT